MRRTHFRPVVAVALLMLLTACTPQGGLPRPGPDFVGFGWTVDPATETITPFLPAGLRAQTATPPGETRRLVNGDDLDLTTIEADFQAGDTLELRVSLRNLTEAFGFALPIVFAPADDLIANIDGAVAPTVTPADLGGDDLLNPSEVSAPLLFTIAHRGRPFTYFFDIEAAVEEVPDQADLTLSKVDDLDPVLGGDTLVYTLTVGNAGPRAAQGTILEDTLPAGVAFVSTSGCDDDPGGVPICTLGSVAVGAVVEVSVVVTVNSGFLGTLTNVAEVTGDTPDPDPGNNQAVETTEVEPPKPPTANDDGVAAGSAPGDPFHGALDATLSATDGGPHDLDGNDDRGLPRADIVAFGGGDLGGAVGDHAPGDVVPCGGGCSLSVNADGSFTFTPGADFTGPFSVDYRLENSEGFDDATVTLAVGARPAASADSYDAIGNVGLDAAPDDGLIANDVGDRIAIVAADATSVEGGAVAVDGDGAFRYDPPPGFEGSDSFDYQLGNGFGSVVATATVTVDGAIWFVDGALSVQGDGRLISPFNSLDGGYNASALIDPDDGVFLAGGSYPGGVTLLDGQALIGEGSTASLADALGLTPPPASRPLPSTGGAPPTISNAAGHGVVLGLDNLVRGLDIGATAGTGMIGTLTSGTLTVREVGIGGAGGGVAIEGGTIDVVLSRLSADSGSHEGIALTDVGGSFEVLDGGGTLSTTGVAAIDIDGAPLEIDLTFESVSVSGAANGLLLRDTTGSFSVTGSGTADGSGGSVSGIDERGVSVIAGENVALANMTFSGTPTGDGSGCDAAGNAGCHAAIHLEQSSGIALDNVDIAGGTQQGVNGLDIRDLTLSNSTVTGCGDGVDEGCLRLVDLAGSSAIIDSDLSFPADRVARIVNTDTDLTLTVSGSSFRDSQSSGVGADGLEIASSGGSTSVDIEDSTFVRNATNGLQLLNEGSADVRVDVTGSTFDPQAGPGIGIDLATADTASLTFNVIGNPRIGGNGGSAVNIFADGDATVRGRIDDNPDIRTGGAGTSGFGIRVAANGDADVVAQIEGNTISEIGFDAGIQVLSRLGSTGRADAVVRDNSVDVDAGALYDIWIQAQDGNTVCAHLSDNSASGSGVSALRARTSTAGAEVILQGSGASAAAVWNGGNNTPVDAVSSSHVGTLTLGGTCAVVAHPLP